jgi:large subunit ribosomal protein L18
MSRGPRYRVPFRRRREGLTDYRHRLKLLKSGLPRAVVRRSNGRFWVAVTHYDPKGDRIIASADSKELPPLGFPNRSLTSTPAAYLTGYLAGLRAKSAGTTEAVLDLGLRHAVPGGRVLSALKGLLDAGLEIPHSEKGFPGADRLNGQHLGKPLPEPLDAYRLKLPPLAAQSVGATP